MEHLKARGPQAAERSPHAASSRRRRLAWYDAGRLAGKGRTVGRERSEEEGCLSALGELRRSPLPLFPPLLQFEEAAVFPI